MAFSHDLVLGHLRSRLRENSSSSQVCARVNARARSLTRVHASLQLPKFAEQGVFRTRGARCIRAITRTRGANVVRAYRRSGVTRGRRTRRTCRSNCAKSTTCSRQTPWTRVNAIAPMTNCGCFGAINIPLEARDGSLGEKPQVILINVFRGFGYV